MVYILFQLTPRGLGFLIDMSLSTLAMHNNHPLALSNAYLGYVSKVARQAAAQVGGWGIRIRTLSFPKHIYIYIIPFSLSLSL